MSKSLLITGLLAAAGAAAYFVFANGGADQSEENQILTNIETAANQGKLAADLIKKEQVSDLPIASKSGPWPKVVADEMTFAFGRMQVRSNKSHEFVIRNNGDADLELKAGNTTCKCTKFGFGDDEDNTDNHAIVKPGESVKLIMNWKGGEVADRGFRHGGDVFTNDPENLVLKFAVEGAIEMPFELLPSIWNVGNVYAEQPGKIKATLGSKMYPEIDIVSIHSPSGKVKITPSPLSVDTKALNSFLSGFSLDIEVADDIPAGIFEEEIQIQITQQEALINVTVFAKKQGVLRIQQMAGTSFDQDKLILQLGSFPASEGREARMLLIVDEKDMSEPFRITETSAEPSFIKASIEEIGAPSGTVHRYLLKIAVPPGKPHVQKVASAPGFIKLSTNHSSGEGIHFNVLLYSN